VPLTYRIDEGRGLITLTLSGRVTAADITGYFAASRADRAFRPSLRRLIVAEAIESFPQLPQVREITKIGAHPEPLEPVPRVAVVADTPLGLGMVAIFLGHWGLSDRYRVFDALPSALAWLVSD
jgi:hypothetical protein